MRSLQSFAGFWRMAQANENTVVGEITEAVHHDGSRGGR
jgi:hypothetical protein